MVLGKLFSMYNVQCAMYNAVPAVGMRILQGLAVMATASTGLTLQTVTLYVTSGREEKMREILFRGKQTSDGKWVYGFYIENETFGNTLIPSIIPIDENGAARFDDDGYDIEIYVIPETVGQYTGLTDKNGKQIFEGDILGAKHPKQMKAVPCLVKYGEYKDEDGLSDCRYLGFCLQALGKCCSILTPLSDGIEYEVIGNIHDNPELLERGAKNE